jgi:Ribbon-helix-helix protein, copG family
VGCGPHRGARTELLRVRLDSSKVEALDWLAALRGVTRSELVRELIREASPVLPAPPPTLEDLLEPFSYQHWDSR